jgi:alpha-L-fucosidase
MNQLTELLTQYGKIAEVWFDGACGEGPNGKKQVYDWASYYALIRKLQPDAVIAVMGPDVRWVGTESGYGRETEWSVVPLEVSNQDQIASSSQQNASNEGFIPSGDMTQQDLGSRKVLMKASQLIWYPSEVDVSIRPGWFWHASENDRVKTPEKLLDIYFSSVGRNSVLLLNIPPDERGLIHENDIKALRGWRTAINNIFSNNLASESMVHGFPPDANPAFLFDGNDNTSQILRQEIDSVIDFDLGSVKTFDVLALQEDIRYGQHVEKFRLEAKYDGEWKSIVSGTTIGYKRLLRFKPISARYIRLVIEQSRANTYLAEFGLYRQLPEAFSEPASGAFKDSLTVKLVSNETSADIYYTIDGTEPDINSQRYEQPIQLKQGATLRYFALRNDGVPGFVRTSSFGKAKYSISLKNAADPAYDGGGPIGLADGIRGSIDHADGKWTGFSGNKLEATIDLGKKLPVKKISLSLLESTASWIFKPELVTFGISDDGIIFREICSIKTPAPTKDHTECFMLKAEYKGEARYIKVTALPLQSIPGWHAGAGTAAWVFADEIIIE